MKLSQIQEAKYYMHDSWPNKIRRQAHAERKAGAVIEIEYGLPSIGIRTSAGEEYYWQEENAQNMLDAVPEDISPEDYFLFQSVSW